jgi:hypothetical protein
MNALKEPRPETFQYGFLTSRIARTLHEYSPGKKLDDESRRLLDRAQNFMDQILNGEALVSSNKENLTPSLEGLQAFHYGIEALSVMQQMQMIAQLEDPTGVRSALSTILKTLTAVQNASPNGDLSSDNLRLAAKFFDVIADALLNEALEYSHPEQP